MTNIVCLAAAICPKYNAFLKEFVQLGMFSFNSITHEKIATGNHAEMNVRKISPAAHSKIQTTNK